MLFKTAMQHATSLSNKMLFKWQNESKQQSGDEGCSLTILMLKNAALYVLELERRRKLRQRSGIALRERAVFSRVCSPLEMAHRAQVYAAIHCECIMFVGGGECICASRKRR
jgi:hypothetical protein